jgi:hypothetical protein
MHSLHPPLDALQTSSRGCQYTRCGAGTHVLLQQVKASATVAMDAAAVVNSASTDLQLLQYATPQQLMQLQQ